MSTRGAESGFTLIELLVALAVFSLAVLALLNVSGENTRTAAGLEARVLAGVVAENRATEALVALAPPAIGEQRGADAAAGRSWLWTRRVSRTPDPMILRVDVAVRSEAGRLLSEVTLFLSVA